MKKYSIKIDNKKCIGCGSCAALCPEIFEMKDGKAIAKKKISDVECIKEATDSCPTEAIILKEVK